jgi:hypothetical protein
MRCGPDGASRVQPRADPSRNHAGRLAVLDDAETDTRPAPAYSDGASAAQPAMVPHPPFGLVA